MKILFKRFFYILLQKIYSFDSWHSKVFFENSKYMFEVSEICNSNNFDLVIELGCGLGEQLILINAKNKIGIDIDNKVIKTAKLLRKKKISFFCCDILRDLEKDDDLFSILRKYNNSKSILIMVNWIHAFKIQVVSDLIQKIDAINDIKYLLVDLIIDNSGNYKYNHKKMDFENLGYSVIDHKISSDNIRELLLLKKK